jgi:porin
MGSTTAAPEEDHTHLLGDWGGVRSRLAEHGIIFDFQVTQFYQGVVDGSPGTDDWQYGVKGDLYLTLIGEQLGLWKGLIVNAHLETRAGDDVNALTGLSPANVNMLMPDSSDTTALTQLIAIQMVSKQVGVIAGKLSAFDFVEMVFHTGRGVDGFMNTSMVLPVGLGGTLGLGFPLAFLAKFKGKEVQGWAGVYGPNNCATTTCVDSFKDGPAYSAFWKFYHGSGDVGPRSSYTSFGGTYSTKEYTVIDPSSIFINPGVGLALTDKQESWSVFSVLNYQLWADASNPNRDLNFRGMYTVTDGVANPIKWTATAALEVNGPIRSRDKDTFGVGYFHNELSNGFKNTVGPLLSVAATVANRTRTRIAIEDTDGFEAYYEAQLTPWFALTGDVQVITETLSTKDTKVVVGLRGKTVF